MDERNSQEKAEERIDPRESSEQIEDLDVPGAESEDVKGGQKVVHTYSFKQGWPKKYE
jgi:hypothetical protein